MPPFSPHPPAPPTAPDARRGGTTGTPPGVVRLRGIAKSFPPPGVHLGAGGGRAWRDVLRGVSLELRPGEIMGVVGTNGAGKTTLLEILATAQLPSSGAADVCGFDLVTQAAAVRRVVGYSPASADSFYPRLTGRANLEFFAALHDLSPAAGCERTRHVLALVGGGALAEITFQRCSTGMKQKLGVARALLGDPAVLLLDEPTRSLDPDAQRDFHDLLRRRLADEGGKTVLLVTHNLNEARTICDRVALLRDGLIAGVWAAADLPAEIRFEPES